MKVLDDIYRGKYYASADHYTSNESLKRECEISSKLVGRNPYIIEHVH